MATAKPRQLGSWVLEGRLGAGAFGAVFAAHHVEQPSMRRAVKVLVSPDEQAHARFQHEAELLARVRHPGVVAIHEVGRAGDDVFIVMELVPGRSLRAVLEETRGAGLPLARALPLVAKIGRAVGAAHAQGICHRDLKPDNVIVSPEGEPRVVDFGLAIAGDLERLTKTGGFVGTIGYMAPEQLEGKGGKPGPPTDVYSLGAILYELATGSPLAVGSSGEVLARALTGNHTPATEVRPGLPRQLDALLEKAVAVSPGARFPDATAFAAAVDEFEALRATGRLESGASRVGLVVALVLLLAVACVVAAVFLSPKKSSTENASPASVGRTPPAPASKPTPTPVASPALPAWFTALAPAERPDPLPPQLKPGKVPGEYVNDKDGSILVFVPAIQARAGTEDDVEVLYEDERPAHDVTLSPYFLGKLEVSNAQFARFVAEKGHVTLAEKHPREPAYGPHILGATSTVSATTVGREKVPIPGATWRDPVGDHKVPQADLPVVQVAWIDAVAYASWAGVRLATEAEWELAARWEPREKRLRVYPWGDDAGETSRGNLISALDGKPPEGLVPVVSFASGASPAGALNMAGNVREWVLDDAEIRGVPAEHLRLFYSKIASGEVSSLDPCYLYTGWDSYASHVHRGGSFRDIPAFARGAYRSSSVGSDDVTGFRIALSADGSPRPRGVEPWKPK